MGLPRVRSAYAWSVHQMDSGRTDSRSMKRPVLWSICASTSTMPPMAVSRRARAGCSMGFALSWARMSGEALTRVHACRSRPLTAIEDWVLGSARNVPLRTPEQLRQLQFHCGNPPPAAEPSTRIFTVALGRAGSQPRAERAYGARRPGSQPLNLQRFAMYIVISMPKRKSVARGVSQRIVLVPALGQLDGIHRYQCILPRRRGELKRIIMKVAS